jgi:RNA polymerase sigma-70 factor (ECF subfamily)
VVDWQLIVKKYGPAVWLTAYRLLGNDADTADCFQETFTSALQLSRRQRIRSFSALLTRLATTRAIDLLRRRLRQSKIHAEPADSADVPGKNPGPLQQVQTKELADRLRNALIQLPPQEAQVFCLRYFNDMSYRQIAGELGIKTNTAGVLLHRSRAKLNALLDTPAVKEEM